MGRTKLTQSEKTALLVVIRKELKILFEETEVGLPDYDKVTAQVIDNLTYIIEDGLKVDPENNDIYEIFAKK